MISPILRWLGALAGLGSAILSWFLGGVLAKPVRQGQLLHMDTARYELMAFLFVPALILAVVALYWVAPRVDGQGPIPEGRRLRLMVVLALLGAFLIGFAR